MISPGSLPSPVTVNTSFHDCEGEERDAAEGGRAEPEPDEHKHCHVQYSDEELRKRKAEIEKTIREEAEQ